MVNSKKKKKLEDLNNLIMSNNTLMVTLKFFKKQPLYLKSITILNRQNYCFKWIFNFLNLNI
jgi:hypothetical protein